MDRRKKKNGKLVITFDDEARTEYLTGFRKRKQARRKFGLAMQKMKDRQKRLDDRKDRREAMNDTILERTGKSVEELRQIDEEEEEAQLQAAARGLQGREVSVAEYSDPLTQAKFGQAVTVTTSVGIPGLDVSDDESGGDEEPEPEPERKRRPPAISLLPRGQKPRGNRVKWDADTVELFNRLLPSQQLPSKRSKLREMGGASSGGKQPKGAKRARAAAARAGEGGGEGGDGGGGQSGRGGRGGGGRGGGRKGGKKQKRR